MQLSGQRILTMEFVDGCRLTDIAGLRGALTTHLTKAVVMLLFRSVRLACWYPVSCTSHNRFGQYMVCVTALMSSSCHTSTLLMLSS